MVYKTIPRTFNSKLDQSKMGAIKQGIELGVRIQKLFPLIVEDYKEGKSLNELVRDYNIQEVFRVRNRVAQMAMFYALKGYNGYFDSFTEPAYSGLMNISEFKRAAEEHHIECGRKLGLSYGKKVGRLTYKKGIGVHSMSYEERRKAGQEGMMKRGYFPWSDKEIKKLYKLSQNPNYQCQSGNRIKAIKIAEKINNIFYKGKEIRTPRAIIVMLCKHKKKRK